MRSEIKMVVETIKGCILKIKSDEPMKIHEFWESKTSPWTVQWLVIGQGNNTSDKKNRLIITASVNKIIPGLGSFGIETGYSSESNALCDVSLVESVHENLPFFVENALKKFPELKWHLSPIVKADKVFPSTFP